MSTVPPPPPGVVVPVPPLAMPPTAGGAVAPASGDSPAKVVKPGGVALDMSDLFGPPKNASKKAVPPWERKKTPPSATTPSPAAGKLVSSPPPPTQRLHSFSSSISNRIVLQSTAERSYPSLSSLPPPAPAPGAAASSSSPGDNNAPVVVTRKSVPAATLAASPNAAPLPMAAVLTSTRLSTPSLSPDPLSTSSSPAPQPAVVLASAVATSVPLLALSSTPASAVPPPPPPPASAGALPAFSSVVTGDVMAAVGSAPALPGAAAAPPQPSATPLPPPPGSDPAAVAVSARIVEETLREMRPHLPPPTRTVIAPHMVFQGKVQTVQVSPLGPVPSRAKSKKGAAMAKDASPGPAAAATGTSDVWHNQYDLRPSPSSAGTLHHSHPLANADAGAKRSTKAPNGWRGAHWQHVDVHRYIARRYFGEPPPVEH